MVVLFPSCSSNLFCAPCSQVRRSRPKVVQRTTLFMYAQTSNKLVVWKKRVLGIQSTEIENCCCRCLGIKQQQTKHAYTHMHVDTRMNTEMPPPPPPTHTENPSDDLMFRSCVSWARYWKVEREREYSCLLKNKINCSLKWCILLCVLVLSGYFVVEGKLYCETHARRKAQPPGPDMVAVPVYRWTKCGGLK